MPHRSMDPAVGNGEARTVQPRPAPQAHFHVVVSAEWMYGAGDYLSDVVQPDFAAMKEALAAKTGQVELFNHDTPALRAVPGEAMKMATTAEVMPVLKWKNSPRFAALDAEAQWLSMPQSEKMGRVGR